MDKSCAGARSRALSLSWKRACASSRMCCADRKPAYSWTSVRAGALRAYGRLISLAIELLSTGAILVACSCSAQVSADEFFGAVRKSVARSGRKLQEIETTAHAPDHPATFKEAHYLKTIYLKG